MINLFKKMQEKWIKLRYQDVTKYNKNYRNENMCEIKKRVGYFNSKQI